MATPDTRPREVELKLALPAGSEAALASHPKFHTPAERRHEVTTYFDTPEHRLEQAGISLRVRCAGGRTVQTVKAARRNAVVNDREEWEWPLQQARPDLSLLGETGLAGALPEDQVLEPVLTTDVDRTTRRFALEGGTLVEAALDVGTIAAGEARETIRELELELHAGPAAPLYRLALELHAATPLIVTLDSKFERGLRLRTGSTATAHKAEAIALAPDLSAVEVFRRIIAAALGHLMMNRPAAWCGSAEGVHQMRVAIRRLRAALVLFKPHLEPHATARFEDELRRLGQVFGAARDWDVFCLEMLPGAFSTAGAGSWRDLLAPPAEAKREAAHRQVTRELDSPAFTTLVLGLAAWVEAGREHLGVVGDAALDDRIGRLAGCLLDRLAQKVDRRARHLGQSSDAERHALRKSLKKMRYAVDDLRAIYPADDTAAYQRGCKRLQQVLGRLNDAVTATALAFRLSEGARADLAGAAAALAEYHSRGRSAALHKLDKRWQRFAAEKRFWG
jgi:inorganic triphosphatase YgiF